MQESALLVLAFLLAHLVGDFAIQNRRVEEHERQGEMAAYIRHGAVHLLLAYLAVLLFAPSHLTQWRLHVALLAIVLAHLVVDYLEARLASRRAVPPWASFFADQAVHLSLLLVIVALAYPSSQSWLTNAFRRFEQHRVEVLWMLVVYTATIFGGGFLIRLVLPRRAADGPPLSAQETARREEERRLGLYIGWLERLLVLTAVLAKSPTAVGFIVAAKSIVRFKKVESSDEFAEYFLLGTFSSLILALAGGLLLRWLMWGTLDLE